MLAGKGYQKDYGDETRYRFSIMAFNAIKKGDIKQTLEAIFPGEERPGFTTLNIIPAVMRFAGSKLLHKDIETVDKYTLFTYNFIVFVLILLVHYRVSLTVLNDKLLALLSVLLYSAATNSYIYLRHAFPYDAALLMIYFGFYLAIKAINTNKLGYKKGALIGFLIVGSFLVYPGYFPLVGIVFAVIFFYKLTLENFKQRFLACFIGVSTGSAVIVLFELVSRTVNKSYYAQMQEYYDNIQSRFFAESPLYLFEYLMQVDPFIGVLIIVGLIVTAVMVFMNLKNTLNNLFNLLFLFMVLLYVYYSVILGYYGQKLVLYGRLLHQFFPFLFIMAVYAFHIIFEKLRLRASALTGFISVICLATYMAGMRDFLTVEYPQDTVWRVNDYASSRRVQLVSECDDDMVLSPHKGQPDSSNYKKLVAVNIGVPWPVESAITIHPYKDTAGYTKIFSKPHYITLKAYQFEVYSPNARAIVTAWNPQIKLYLEK